MLKSWLIILITLYAIGLTGCSSAPSFSQQSAKKSADDGKTADQLLARARASMKSGAYEEAIKHYETLEARYPLGRYAQQSLLETAFAYYKAEEEDTALDTIDRFKRMYPRSPITDYALYLRGLINFNRGKSIIDKVFPRSFADLDNVRQKESFHDFTQLINRYPSSKYSTDAQQRLQHLRNSLATSEVNVAKYYMKRNAYVAAFNRAEYTIKHYQGSPAVIEALKIKIAASNALGKPKIAAATRRVMRLNFPAEAVKLK